MGELIGEVIQTSTSEITGQSKLKTTGPEFGSFVCTGKDAPCIAVVYNVEVVGPEGYRKPGMTGFSEDELPQKHPQLYAIMRKQFSALVIGELSETRFLYGLPSRPPGLHAGITLCDDKIVSVIVNDLGFLRLLFDSGKTSSEELLMRVCRNLLTIGAKPNRRAAVKIGKALSDLYRDDYESLRRMMTRLETWLTN